MCEGWGLRRSRRLGVWCPKAIPPKSVLIITACMGEVSCVPEGRLIPTHSNIEKLTQDEWSWVVVYLQNDVGGLCVTASLQHPTSCPPAI